MQKFLNNYETILTSAILSTDDVLTVEKSTLFDEIVAPSVGDSYYLTISDGTNIEIIEVIDVVQGVSTDTLTVYRDVSTNGHGTFNFSAGASVKLTITAETLNYLSSRSKVHDSFLSPPISTVDLNPTLNEYLGFSTTSTLQININSDYTNWRLHLNGSGYGVSAIVLYRNSTSYSWPIIYFNGSPATVEGTPPASGSKALLICYRYRASGYIASEIVSFKWQTPAA